MDTSTFDPWIAAVDFKKAFDSVSHAALFAAMEEMGVEQISDISYMTEEELQEQGASLKQAQQLIAAAAAPPQNSKEKKTPKKEKKKKKKKDRAAP